ncbi:hypothetical protein KNCP2_14290 [Candidatus Rickettsia kedanie]|uniref:Uncharacterized protein n=1 Tax=Candidatus Rickettsia kedanie TaxID=3115352 RepID=A0ABP9TV68_9RICK
MIFSPIIVYVHSLSILVLSPSAEIIIYITKIIVSIITGITHIASNVNINNIMLEYTIFGIVQNIYTTY